MEIKFKW